VSKTTLSLLQREPGGVGGALIQSLSLKHRTGAFASGAAKLLQNVVAELMTRRGSVRFDPGYGCDLVDQIGITNISSLAEVGHALNVAILDITENIRSRMIGNEPLDELLEKIVIEQMRQEYDRVIAVLRIHSRAGEKVSYDFAIKFNP
jgi:hypothetical protein